MIKLLRRSLCFHIWEHEQDIDGRHIWVCRRCDSDKY